MAKICHAFLPSFGFHVVLSTEARTLLFKCKRNINIFEEVSFKKLLYLVMSLVGLKSNTKEQSIRYYYPVHIYRMPELKNSEENGKVTFFPLHKFVNG